MARTTRYRTPAPTRTLVTLAEVQKDPARFQDTVIWMATEELLQLSHPENPRLHDPEGDVPEIFKSLRDFGWQGSYVTLNPVTGLITGGHGRVLAAEMGMAQPAKTFWDQWERWLKVDPDRQEVADSHQARFNPEYWFACPVAIPPGLIPIDQKSAMVRLNNSRLDGQDDRERMAELLSGLDAPRQLLAAWVPGEAQEFIDLVKGRLGEGEDEEDEGDGEAEDGDKEPGENQPEPIESRVKPGEIWALGRHRMLVGDSTDKESVRKLLDGVLADCCWTDPPYGVSYVGKTADALTIENDGAKDLPVLIKNSFKVIAAALKPGSPVYVAHPAGVLQQVFVNEFIEAFSLRQQLVWVKNTFALGHSDYHYRHEPILFGYTKGGEGRRGRGSDNWYGDHSQDSVFEVDKPSRNGDHPTMKPLELIEAMLKNSTHSQSVLFEPFLGSGSTLITAQRMPGKRTVYGCELSPEYCEIVIRRFEEFTGEVASLAGHL